MACPHKETCELFPRFRLQNTLRVWQINYCEGEFQRCARYQLSNEGKQVPSTLLPNGRDLSDFIPLQKSRTQ